MIGDTLVKSANGRGKHKEKVGTIGGITSGQDPIECGSFYNSSDNRVARSVYKEDLTSMSVTSLSFNPKNWMCTACPKSHSVVEEGGRGGGGWQTCHRGHLPKFPGGSSVGGEPVPGDYAYGAGLDG